VIGSRRTIVFLLRRTLHAVPLVLGIVTLTFFLIHATPGDPVYLMAGEGGDAAYYAAMRARYGLDRPLPAQYTRYLRSVASGDFGFSYAYQQPVGAIVWDRVPATLVLASAAFVLATALGIVLGVIGAAAPGSVLDVTVRTITSVLYAAPAFWIGQLLLVAFAVTLPIFPVGGMRSLRESIHSDVGDVLWHLVLPVASLTVSFFALTARVTRASVIAERGQNYVRAARSRGLSQAAALLRHAVPNALLPVVSVIGHHAGTLLTGAGLTEAVFGWPGLGQLLLDATNGRDYPLIIAILLAVSVLVVVANIAADVLYTVLDPRVEL
jgi:peptide/nickel transport system permease protein